MVDRRTSNVGVMEPGGVELYGKNGVYGVYENLPNGSSRGVVTAGGDWKKQNLSSYLSAGTGG